MAAVRPSHRDFSGGQLNEAMWRRDDLEIVKAGARVMENMLSRTTGQARSRFGRRARFKGTGARVERLRMTANDKYYLDFSTGKLTIRDTDGVTVALNSAPSTYLWTSADLASISWTLAYPSVVICFPGMWPQVAEWDPDTKDWTFGDFAFVERNGIKYAPFWRSSAPSATLTPSARTGSITLTSSASLFTSFWIGRTVSLLGRQVVITAVTDVYTATATVSKKLSEWVEMSCAATEGFSPQELAETETTKQKIEIGTVNDGASVQGTLMHSVQLSVATATDTLIGDSGSAPISGFSTTSTPQPVMQWTEEFMTAENCPSVCFFVQNRLGFAGFPKKPDAMLCSAVNNYANFWVDASASGWTQSAGAGPASAIFEYAKDSAEIKYAIDYGDILLFTDRGVYQIPVSTSNPFKPGSVEYRAINNDACADVQPVKGPDMVLYVNEGRKRISAIIATGAASRSFTSRDLTESHSDLLSDPVSMAIATGDSDHPERLIYVVNSDGTAVVGRFVEIGDKAGVGWAPWSEAGETKWVTLADQSVEFVSDYNGSNILQIEDGALYVDAGVYLNDIPAELAAGGTGTLWWLAGETVTVMDGRRDYGDREVDSAGELVTFVEDDFSGETVSVGIPFYANIAPIVPNMGGGENRGQRKNMRKLSEITLTVKHCNGYSCNGKEFPGVAFDDSAEVEPDYRQETHAVGNIGRSFDPQVPVQMERPGPFEIIELSYKVTI